MTEVISSALNFMRLSFSESLPELSEAVADRGVVDVVADLDDEPADERRVDLEPQHGGPAERPGEGLAQRVGLGVAERYGGPDGDWLAILPRVPGRPGGPADRPEQAEPAVTVQHAEKVHDRRQGTAVERPDQHPVLLFAR